MADIQNTSLLIGPLSVGVAICSDENQISTKMEAVEFFFLVSNIESLPWASVGGGERQCGGSVVFVCLWFCSSSAVQVLVYTPVPVHIWLPALINHVLCIF